MKARTKAQRALVDVSDTLPEITKIQSAYAYQHCFQRLAYRSKTKGTGCLECGHIWQMEEKDTSVKCPACNVKLSVVDTRKKQHNPGKKYFSMLDVRGEYQVVRLFELIKIQEVGKPARRYMMEVVRQFFNPEKEMQVIARCRTTSFNIDSFNGDLECRDTAGYYGNKYDLWADATYPKIKVLPAYARNGYTYAIKEVSQYKVMRAILCNSKAETLIKSRQVGLLEAYVGSRDNDIYRYWNSIKIAIRNNQIIKPDDTITWLDYLKLLAFFNKDLNSPKYLFPADLKAAHDELVIKKQRVEKTRESERKRRVAIENQVEYEAAKKAFFGMLFTNGKITVKVLESVPEFAEEGLKLHHCVFTNEYFKKQDSLILSARIDGKPVETIEVSLDEMKVKQSRGLQNLPTPHHDEIISLVRKNLPKIRKVYNESRRQAA
ncbi:PcfJ domain-containing protein [Mucilaginibacter sabulilitoris]|uniref:PcfJ domain-containing protein n=1 Tax=Mucilaginibacter sabulilitoris TaxID=1173583 RepID=A0ABZ0TJE4_9SPHI|nr:PcfJ domain-containing protein [Mucilaginibacter sabulilitoris]WPU91834.1 PcfJ domain-containing protein [Mucilaginibacter sabulilitoris]